MNRLEYEIAVADLRDGLDPDGRAGFDQVVALHTMSPAVTLGLTYFLGALGIDRFRIGDWGIGLLKLAWLPLLIWGGVIDANVSYQDNSYLSMVSGLSSLVQIALYFDGLFTPGRTRRANLAMLKVKYAAQPPV